ncbi:putative amidohydrolase-like protein [Umbelopsis sp. PMI_123]|nr:putative amidohydrolase-like protein [Umbelopsis sp. PMI_123]
MEETGGDPSGWPTPSCTVEQAKAHMKELGIASAIVSVTAPATTIYANDVDKGRNLARKCNVFCAKLAKDDPTRYGWFATLPPLTDVDRRLEELDYAFNQLGADGVTVLSTYPSNGTSLYLGNESFHPIWDKLNSLKAIAFIHPSGSIMPPVNKYAPKPLFDYPQETTRTADDLVLSGTKAKFPNDLKSFYYDTALSTTKGQLLVLLEIADPSRIFYGSDVPYAPIEAIKFVTKQLDGFFSDDKYKHLAQKIERENALALFPKFSQPSV